MQMKFCVYLHILILNSMFFGVRALPFGTCSIQNTKHMKELLLINIPESLQYQELQMHCIAWCYIMMTKDIFYISQVRQRQNCKSLPFFYCLTFEKGRLLYIHPVGQSVGRLVDVTINYFNIQRHKSPILTQYHLIPISTKLY